MDVSGSAKGNLSSISSLFQPAKAQFNVRGPVENMLWDL